MVHAYRQKGFNIALDVNSGAVHLLDEVSYALLELVEPPLSPNCPESAMNQLLERFSRIQIEESYDELRQLWHEGALFLEDDYIDTAKEMTLSPVKALCLNVSHDCNLRCAYCFAGQGDYSGERMVMTAETGKAAIDFLLRQSQGRQNLEVDFFGGEPLMNFGVVKEVVEYARSKEQEWDKHFRFTITTNGLLLDDDKLEYINREMSNVVLSLDGRREVNDRVRARVDGSSCYDSILPKFQRLVETRGDKEYYVRGTFTKYNKDFAQDVIALADLGFDQLSIEPVVTAPENDYALTEGDLPEIFAEYERLADWLYERRQSGKFVNFFHFMLDLNQGPCAIKRLRGCGCGNEYVAVVPGGDIYPCHQFVGMDEWLMGNVHTDEFSTPIKEQFAHTTVYDKEDCRDCWAKFYCSGGCTANNVRYEGSLYKSNKLSCEMEKKRVECAIAMKARVFEQED